MVESHMFAGKKNKTLFSWLNDARWISTYENTHCKRTQSRRCAKVFAMFAIFCADSTVLRAEKMGSQPCEDHHSGETCCHSHIRHEIGVSQHVTPLKKKKTWSKYMWFFSWFQINHTWFHEKINILWPSRTDWYMPSGVFLDGMNKKWPSDEKQIVKHVPLDS